MEEDKELENEVGQDEDKVVNGEEVTEVKDNKYMPFIIAAVIVAFLVIIVAWAVLANGKSNDIYENSFTYMKSDGTEVNISEELLKAKRLDGLSIQITSLAEHDNYTRILGKITNTSEETLGGYDIECILLDKEGKEITRVGGFIPTVEPGEEGDLNCSIIGSFANIFNVNIVKK